MRMRASGRAAALLLLAAAMSGTAALQEGNDAVRLIQELTRRRAETNDAEVRHRIDDVVEGMRSRARLLAFGEPEDPDRLTVRLHDSPVLWSRPEDRPAKHFWNGWSRDPSDREPFCGYADDESILDPEMVVELVQENVEPETWDQGDCSIEVTPGRQICVYAVPSLHRRVRAFLESLEHMASGQLDISLWAFASSSPHPPELAESADGTISDDAFRRLARRAVEGADVEEIGSVMLSAQPDQLVSAFSGETHRIVEGYEDTEPRIRQVPAGLCVELVAIPGMDGIRIRGRVAFTKLLGLEEWKTPKGPMHLPRLAVVEITEDRFVADGRYVLLARQGTLPGEAEVPRHVFFVARFSSDR